MCKTVAEANELIQLAEAAGVPLQVGHIERFNPAFEELVRRPIRPKFVEAERHGPFTGRSIDIGAVLDLMIHDLDLILALVGGPVGGPGGRRRGVRRTRGHGQRPHRLRVRLRRPRHRQPDRRPPKRRLRVWAPEGYAGIDFVSRKTHLVQVCDEVRRHGLRADKLDAAAKARLKDELFGRHLEAINVDGDRKGDQLTAELRSFVDCVRHRQDAAGHRRGRPRRPGPGRAGAGRGAGSPVGRAPTRRRPQPHAPPRQALRAPQGPERSGLSHQVERGERPGSSRPSSFANCRRVG